MLVIVAMAIGVKSRPSMPSRPNSGIKTKITSTVAYRIELRTSLEAVAMMWSVVQASGLLFAAGTAAPLSLKRRQTFSTSTIASSTTMPMATASPPSVIEFTLTPKALKVKIVTAKDSGIAISVMKVVRRFSRKRNRMIATMIAPSRMAS